MKNLNIPVGISDFERIRELNYYYAVSYTHLTLPTNSLV